MFLIGLHLAVRWSGSRSAKCKVYFGGVDDNVEQEILRRTGFDRGTLSFKYLGVAETIYFIWRAHNKKLITSEQIKTKCLSFENGERVLS